MVVPDHLTSDSLREIQNADWVGYVVDAETAAWLTGVTPRAESLEPYYDMRKDRVDTYQEMADRVVDEAVQGKRSCLVCYGHPLAYCTPPELIAKRARELKIPTKIYPAISSLDCLLADLQVDVAGHGYMAVEAHALTVYQLQLDPGIGLVIWQIRAVGEFKDFEMARPIHRGYLKLVSRILAQTFPPEHPALIYSAAMLPGHPPQITPTTISRLHEAEYTAATTLYIPPLGVEAPQPPPPHAPILVGLGPRIPDSVTQAGKDAIRSAARVYHLDLDDRELTALRELRGDVAAYDGSLPEGSVLCCSGHPCHCDAAMELLRQGLRAAILPAISLDDAISVDFVLDFAEHGYQVRTERQLRDPAARLDLHLNTLYLGEAAAFPDLPGRERHLISPAAHFMVGIPSPEAGPDMGYQVYLARACENLRRELTDLPPDILKRWRSCVDGSHTDAEMLKRSVEFARRGLCQEATRCGVDLSKDGPLEAFREREPDSKLACYFRVLLYADGALKALEQDYPFAPLWELLQ